MIFAHLSDLHLGKRLCEAPLLADQHYILQQILDLLDASPVDGVLLAGDLYDKPVPPAEAVTLLDWFLTQLAAADCRSLRSAETTTLPSGSGLGRSCWPIAGSTSAQSFPAR